MPLQIIFKWISQYIELIYINAHFILVIELQ